MDYLAGAWVVDLGLAPHKENQAVKEAITSHGGVVLFSVTAKTNYLLTTLDLIEQGNNLKITTAFRLGIPVVTRDFLGDCLRLGKKLDVWSYQYLGAVRATEFGVSAESICLTRLSQAASSVLAVAFEHSETSSIVVSAMQRGSSSVLSVCRALLPASIPLPPAPAAAAAAFFSHARANPVVVVPPASSSVSRSPFAPSRSFARPREVPQSSTVLAERSNVSVLSRGPQSALLRGAIDSARQRMAAARSERERVKEEERSRAAKEVAAARSYDIAKPAYCNGELAAARAQARHDRAEAARVLREQRAAEGRDRLRELQRMAEARNALRAAREVKLQALVRRVHGDRGDQRGDVGDVDGADRSQLAVELQEASDEAQWEVEEADRKRQKRRAKESARRRAEEALLRLQRHVQREINERAAREQRRRDKDARRQAYWERRRAEDAEKRRLAYEAFLVREERRRKKEERRQERLRRGIPAAEVMDPVDARKVFVGNVKADDIAQSSEPKERHAAMRQNRLSALRAIFSAAGKITQFNPNVERGFVFVVYRSVIAAKLCANLFSAFEKRQEACGRALEGMRKCRSARVRPDSEIVASAPKPNFYVRLAKPSKKTPSHGPAAPASSAASAIPSAPSASRPSFKAAVVLSPPEPLWGGIQAIRRDHDDAYERWMPHVNVVWPFAAEPDWASCRAVERLRSVARRAQPFVVTLSNFRWFDHSSNCVLWLDPTCEPAGALQALRAALAVEFPEFAENSQQDGEWKPHLTVGQFSKRGIGATASKLHEKFEPIVWQVTELHLITRAADDEPFHVACSIPIGSHK